MQYSETRYLSSKKTVDDRALNRGVVDRLRSELECCATRPLTVLEVGAGLGTMIARLCEWQVLKHANYTLLDVDAQSLHDARGWLADWAKSRQLEALVGDTGLTLRDAEHEINVRFIEAELRDFLATEHDLPKADLLIANAFLDLVDVPKTLPALFDVLTPSGLYYFTINFDGETIFNPGHEADLPLMAAYHRTMDERTLFGKPAGEARCGRHLFGHLRTAGASILAAGSSDWVVLSEAGHYIGDEAYFVEHILHTVELALTGRADIDAAQLAAWLGARRRQLADGSLVYIAHQLDFVGRRAAR